MDTDYIGEGLQATLNVVPAKNTINNSTINVSTLDNDISNALLNKTSGGMSTIASLTGHRPRNASLMLNNFTTNICQGVQDRNSRQVFAHSTLSPKNKQGGRKHISMGSTSLLNTSSLIHYGNLYDTSTIATNHNYNTKKHLEDHQ